MRTVATYVIAGCAAWLAWALASISLVYNPFADGVVTSSGLSSVRIVLNWTAAMAISAAPILVVLAGLWAVGRFMTRRAHMPVQGPALPLFGVVLFTVAGTLFHIGQDLLVGGWADLPSAVLSGIAFTVPEYPLAGLAWGVTFWLLPLQPSRAQAAGIAE